MDIDKEQIEAAAKAIYNLWPESRQYPWQDRGNSFKQDEARDYARAAIASQDTAPSGYISDDAMAALKHGAGVSMAVYGKPLYPAFANPIYSAPPAAVPAQAVDALPWPEMVSAADIPYAQNTPDDWDADYKSMWQKHQVAGRNLAIMRNYAAQLRAALAAQPAEAADNFVPEHWREKARHIVSGKMNIAESSTQAIMLLRVMLAAPVANAGKAKIHYEIEEVREILERDWHEQNWSMDEVELAAKIMLKLGYSGSTSREPNADSLRDKIAAMLAQYRQVVTAGQAQAVAVPDGWRLVPVEPTDAMAAAAISASLKDREAINGVPQYRAMLAAAPLPQQVAQTAKFQLGAHVRKTKGSQWSGKVVGTYSTALTPEGYAVESSTERGSVQIYPAAALELVEQKP